MTKQLNLTILDQSDDYTLYQLPPIALSGEVAVSAELEVWTDDEKKPELILTGDKTTDGDLRHFMSIETEETLKPYLRAAGVEVVSLSPREPGAQSVDQIIYNVILK